MSAPGVEPGLARPQRDVLTTRRCGPLHDDRSRVTYARHVMFLVRTCSKVHDSMSAPDTKMLLALLSEMRVVAIASPVEVFVVLHA